MVGSTWTLKQQRLLEHSAINILRGGDKMIIYLHQRTMVVLAFDGHPA